MSSSGSESSTYLGPNLDKICGPWILDSNFELVQSAGVAVENPGEPELLDFLFQSRRKTWVHRRTTRKNNGLVKRGSDIDVGGLHGVEEQLTDTDLLNIDQTWLEETFWSLVSLTSDLDDSTIWQLLFFDLSDSFEVSGSVEGVTSSGQQVDQMSGDISTSDVQSLGQVVEHDGLVDRNDVSDTVTRVDNNTGGQPLGVQGQDGLDGNVNSAELVLLKHDVHHLLSVLQRVHWRLGEKNLLACCVLLQSLEERVVPKMFHVFPVLYYTVFHRI
ncbi:hypothetical protein WICPIJ_008210 [Wickerhamomyces pijperi]|uniref:Uncharacterized protein n=1 Tax=Wickerhamomyces pijperi TaxID=599730 RepID=A0A9P8PZT2_WICPI|nr:hypothetical protein WICPIJ_008210 [Wickerhamomyces pijperi]